MPVERCARCGTARRGDLQVCVRCETSFDSETDLDRALPRPAAPSRTQSHGTLVALLGSGFVVLALLLWLSVRDVGPFSARIVSRETSASGARLTVEVRNGGAKAGRGHCSIGRVDATTGDARSDFAFLSDRVVGHGAIAQVVQVPLDPGVRMSGRIRC